MSGWSDWSDWSPIEPGDVLTVEGMPGFHIAGPVSPFWTQDMALIFAASVESIAPKFGAHVALTGGCLYKNGPRKDVDIMFYRIRQVERIDIEGLLEALVTTFKPALVIGARKGWVQKARFNGRQVDFFFPEAHPWTGDSFGRYGNEDLV